MSGEILQGFSFAGLKVEAIEDGVREIADSRAAEQFEAVLLRFGESERVAESIKTYLLAIEVIIFDKPTIQIAASIQSSSSRSGHSDCMRKSGLWHWLKDGR